jgi:hypothetical protein
MCVIQTTLMVWYNIHCHCQQNGRACRRIIVGTWGITFASVLNFALISNTVPYTLSTILRVQSFGHHTVSKKSMFSKELKA